MTEKNASKQFVTSSGHPEGFPPLLESLRDLILQARQKALRSVNTIQVQTCWQIGRHIVEYEQGGQARAGYGKRLLTDLANALTSEFGKGFDERNLRNMRAFFKQFSNWNALRSELSWTHYRLLLRVENPTARQWYVREAAEQNWSTRVLERQIGTLYFGISPDLKHETSWIFTPKEFHKTAQGCALRATLG